jgi:hypothetical protein
MNLGKYENCYTIVFLDPATVTLKNENKQLKNERSMTQMRRATAAIVIDVDF